MKVFSRARRPLLVAVLTALSPGSSPAQQQPLDHDAYDVWRTIEDQRISDTGDWVLYTLSPRVGDDELVVRRSTGPAQRIPRAGSARFAPGSQHVVFTISPAHDSVRALKLAGTDSDELPPDTLGILDLTTGEVTRVPDVLRWSLPEEAGGRVAYLVAQPEAADSAAADDEGRTLVLRALATGDERRYDAVVDHAFSEDGGILAIATAGADSLQGVHIVRTATGERTRIVSGPCEYTGLAVAADGGVAFLTDRDDAEAQADARADPDAEAAADAQDATAQDADGAELPSYALYHWREGAGEARAVAWEGAQGLPPGWWISHRATPSFSESGARLFFGTAPRPAQESEDSLLAAERVTLDVWHWQDDLIQPMQLVNAGDERRRTYRAVVHLDRRDRIVQLETPDQPSVDVGREGDADLALAETGVPYRSLVGIESPGFSDVWLVDVLTGERTRIIERAQARAHLSPDARYVAWYDYGDRHWHALDVEDRRQVSLSTGIPYPVWDERNDRPMAPGPYGIAGWTAGDQELLIYDRFDIWAVDPDGRSTPRRITEGFGRDNTTRLRYVRLDRDERAVDPASPVLLSAFNTRTKEAGFYRDRVSGSGRPERLLEAPKRFGRVTRADDADVLLYTREDVAEFPDLWVADGGFRNPRRVSDANPQQAEYNWATAELVDWLSNDGIPLQGLLYRPEDFDPSEEYPMMVYFYERSSDGLHRYAAPLPHRSVIQPTFYASRGYVVFIPDIVYREGYPGESAMDAVMPGVLKLAEEPWVDEHNVGVQGHSWGGYQIAYMITKTDFFKAAGAGAPVANMTSAYGGIRYGTGMSRMFQYERTQSRIGGSLWERPMQYFENSPLFFLESVNTPVLIMHNDQDAAVPFTQGVELFLALRRLGKPAWLINYNDEPHWPTTAANVRDWNIRMQQYFDHFLKGAPAPRWLVEGIPATEKGRTLGLEPVQMPLATEGEQEPVGSN